MIFKKVHFFDRKSMEASLFMKRFICFFYLFCFFQEVRSDFVLHPLEDFYTDPQILKLRVQPGYYTTASNFGPAGGPTVSLNGGGYTRYQLDAVFQYGLTQNLSFFFRLVSSVVSLSQSMAVNQSFFGMNDQSLGMSYRFIGGRSPSFSMDFQLQADFPAYGSSYASTNYNIQTPSLGDGSLDGTGALFMTIPLEKSENTYFYSRLGGGYTYRTGGFSSALPWVVLFGYTPRDFVGSHFFSQMGFQGFYSLKTDLDNNINAPLRVSYGTGGSYIGGGVNPTMVQLRSQFGYRLNLDQEISFTWMQVLWGQDVPVGFYGFFGFQMRFGNSVHSKSPSATSVAEPQEASNAGFLNYNLEAKVLRISDRLNLLKIDKGKENGVIVGDVFDIFQKNAAEQEEAVARARVSHLKDQEAALKIVEYYRETWIEEGSIVKRLIDRSE